MKILVYGAGVLGSLLAARLKQAGFEVDLLARGQRLEDLRRDGICLENALTGVTENVSIQLVERLEPGDAYDLVAVSMGRHQAPSTLPSLAANRCTPNILFLGNNAAGPEEYTRMVGRERVLMGFIVNGGTIRGDVVVHGDGGSRRKTKVNFGEASGGHSIRMDEIANVFNQAGFESIIRPDIDSWLKTHAALIVPVGGALYLSGGGPEGLAANQIALNWLARGFKESLHVLDANKIPVIPAAARVYNWIPARLLALLARKMLLSPEGKLALSHAGHARPEMRLLADQLTVFVKRASLPTPALDQLFAAI
jgi:2-dehydropantoate 2-reductase